MPERSALDCAGSEHDRLHLIGFSALMVAGLVRLIQTAIDGGPWFTIAYYPHALAARILDVPRVLATLVLLGCVGLMLIRWITRKAGI